MTAVLIVASVIGAVCLIAVVVGCMLCKMRRQLVPLQQPVAVMGQTHVYQTQPQVVQGQNHQVPQAVPQNQNV